MNLTCSNMSEIFFIGLRLFIFCQFVSYRYIYVVLYSIILLILIMSI